MKRILVILAMPVLLTTTAAAQSNDIPAGSMRPFRIELGVVHYQVRDDIVAPLRWDGPGPVLQLSYTIERNNLRHDIGLRSTFAFPSNRYDHNALALELNLGYSYLRRVSGDGSQGELYLGGLFDWSFNSQFYETWDDSHMYWLNAYELGPAARWSKTAGANHRLAVSFNFPVVALVARPPALRYYDQERLPKEFFSKPHENMSLTSLHEYLSFGLRGDYTFRAGRKVTLGISYLLNYRSFSEPERITILNNTLLLRILFTRGNRNEDER